MKQVLAQISEIGVNQFQPATGLDMAKVAEIAESLKRYRDNGSKGLHQIPIARQVNGHYEMAFGRHRLEAFRMNFDAGDLFFSDMPLVVKELSDEDMYALMLSENLDRRDISLVEIGEILHAYMTKFKKNSVEAAKKFGKSDEYVRSAVRMLGLPEEGRDALQTGKITVTTGRDLLTVNKLEGEDGVKRALNDILHDNFDSPKDAISNVLISSEKISQLSSKAEWLTAKKFPVKYLDQQGQQKVLNMLYALFGIKKNSSAEILEELRTFSARLLKTPGTEIIHQPEDFPLLRKNLQAFERAVSYASLPACTSCPVHAVIDGAHYCGFKPCATRKQDAWQKKEIDDKVKQIGIKQYVNVATDGQKVELKASNAADKKLFKDRHEDLRLIASNISAYWNFDGVPRYLRVVAVGKTAERRIKAAEEAKIQDSALTATRTERLKNVEREREIDHSKSQFVDRFQWEVAAPAFGSALEGLTNLPLLHFMLDSMMDNNRDADFPEGMDSEDLLVKQALEMKKADGLKQLRRITMFHTFYNKVMRSKMDYGHILDAKKPILKLAEFLQEIAVEWGVKLPKDFDKQAEKYQAELDVALKELKAKK